jgi:hydrogenase nickel incorporation protein HypB
VDFDVKRAMENALIVNPALKFIRVSAKTGDGMEEWLEWIGKI